MFLHLNLVLLANKTWGGINLMKRKVGVYFSFVYGRNITRVPCCRPLQTNLVKSVKQQKSWRVSGGAKVIGGGLCLVLLCFMEIFFPFNKFIL